jgi:hypothetical protein
LITLIWGLQIYVILVRNSCSVPICNIKVNAIIAEKIVAVIIAADAITRIASRSQDLDNNKLQTPLAALVFY